MAKLRGLRKDTLAGVVILTLISGVLWLPRAHAETFEAEGSILVFNPIAAIITGVTEADFVSQCPDPEPISQGFDGYVFAIPASLGTGEAVAAVVGSSPGPYDLDIVFRDAECGFIDQHATGAADESGPVPAGTAFIIVNQSLGADTSFVLTVTGPGGGPGPSASPTATGGLTGGPPPTVAPGSANRTSLAASRKRVDQKQPFALSGRVSSDAGCTGPYRLSIRKRILGSSSFVVVDPDVQVGKDGRWSKSLRSTHSASYTATVAANQSCRGSTSAVRTVQVRARVVVDKPVRCRDPLRVRGSVQPNHKGTNVFLQQRKGSRWQNLDRARLDKRSRFVLQTRACVVPLRVHWPPQSRRNLGASTPIRF